MFMKIPVEVEIARLCIIPRSFKYLSSNIFGYDLNELKSTLDKMVRKKALLLVEGQYLVQHNIKEEFQINIPHQDFYFQKYMGHFSFLKKPHPLDYEWRNSMKTLDDICDFIEDEKLDEKPILILGMPTLFARLYHRDIGIKVVLFEKNKPIVEALSRFENERFKVIETDINIAQLPTENNYYSVFMDPPWYSESFKSFFWFANKFLHVGGLVHISIPSLFTRPSIPDERIDWFTFGHKNGMCIETLKPQALEYVMPFFEFNAFRAAGITDLSPFWRKGDQLIFRKIMEQNTRKPKFTKNESHNEWKEVEFEGVRIRIAMDQQVPEVAEKDVEISHIVPKDILNSVSRRDARRRGVNVWTSGNRVFNVSDPKKFYHILKEILTDRKSFPKQTYIYDFIRSVIDLEKQEHSTYLKWLYYEMERNNN